VKALWRASRRISVQLEGSDPKGSNPRTKRADKKNRIPPEAPYGKLTPMGKTRWEAILGRKISLTATDPLYGTRLRTGLTTGGERRTRSEAIP
jgi:hypothetical protein